MPSAPAGGIRHTRRVRRRAITIAALALLAAGCGSQSVTGGARTSSTPAADTLTTAHSAPVAHPQAVEPVAGDAGATSAGSGGTGGGSAGAGSAPQTAGVSVSSPGTAASLPQPQTNAQVRQELTESGMTASLKQATLSPSGLAEAPIDAPAAVQAVISAGNQIAKLPYKWGGGHATYQDTAYDCSGSLSYVLAAAGLLNQTATSGQLASWGDAGPGKWITIYANAGHTFMYVAGLRFDTVALAETGTRWSDRPADEPDLSSFAVRHPPGL